MHKMKPNVLQFAFALWYYAKLRGCKLKFLFREAYNGAKGEEIDSTIQNARNEADLSLISCILTLWYQFHCPGSISFSGGFDINIPIDCISYRLRLWYQFSFPQLHSMHFNVAISILMPLVSFYLVWCLYINSSLHLLHSTLFEFVIANSPSLTPIYAVWRL